MGFLLVKCNYWAIIVDILFEEVDIDIKNRSSPSSFLNKKLLPLAVAFSGCPLFDQFLAGGSNLQLRIFGRSL